MGTSKSVHNWSVKAGKEDAGGVGCCSCCMRGARRRRVGSVGEDRAGRMGDEGAGRVLWREECCKAKGKSCSREKADCFFAGVIGTFVRWSMMGNELSRAVIRFPVAPFGTSF